MSGKITGTITVSSILIVAVLCGYLNLEQNIATNLTVVDSDVKLQTLQPTLIWNKTWGGSNSDNAYSVTSDSGYIYVSGYTQSYGAGSEDVVLLKYDTNGNMLWYKTWGGSKNDSAQSVTTKGGYLYIVGYTESYGAGNEDVVLLKYDTNGNLFWYKTWGGSSLDIPQSVRSDSGHLYVAGYTYSYGAGGWDAVLLKYDTNGNLLWYKTWGGSDWDFARSVTYENGYLYVAGSTQSYGAGGWDAVLLKYDTNGNLLWYKTWGGGLHDQARSVTYESGYLYVAGAANSYGAGSYDTVLLKYDTNGNMLWYKTWGGSDWDFAWSVISKGGYLYVAGDTSNYGAGSYDAFLLKYDTNGNLFWYKTWGGSNNERTYSVTSDSGYIYVSGYTQSYGAGGYDVFLLKYSVKPIPEFSVVIPVICAVVVVYAICRQRRKK